MLLLSQLPVTLRQVMKYGVNYILNNQVAQHNQQTPVHRLAGGPQLMTTPVQLTVVPHEDCVMRHLR